VQFNNAPTLTSSSTNYSNLNVSNAQTLQGLTPQQVANLYNDSDTLQSVTNRGNTTNRNLTITGTHSEYGNCSIGASQRNPNANLQVCSNSIATIEATAPNSNNFARLVADGNSGIGYFFTGYSQFAFFISATQSLGLKYIFKDASTIQVQGTHSSASGSGNNVVMSGGQEGLNGNTFSGGNLDNKGGNSTNNSRLGLWRVIDARTGIAFITADSVNDQLNFSNLSRIDLGNINLTNVNSLCNSTGSCFTLRELNQTGGGFNNSNIAYQNITNIFNRTQIFYGNTSSDTVMYMYGRTLAPNFEIRNSENEYGFFGIRDGGVGFFQSQANNFYMEGAGGADTMTTHSNVFDASYNGNFGNNDLVRVGDNVFPDSPYADSYGGIRLGGIYAPFPAGIFTESGGNIISMATNTHHFVDNNPSYPGVDFQLDARGLYGRFKIYTYQPTTLEELNPFSIDEKNLVNVGSGTRKGYGDSPQQATLFIKGDNVETSGSDDYPTLIIEAASGSYGQQRDLTQWRSSDGTVLSYIANNGEAHFNNIYTNNLIAYAISPQYVSNNLIPAYQITYDLGSSIYRWRDLFVVNINATTINALDLGVKNSLNVNGTSRLNSTIITGDLNQTYGNATINNYYGRAFYVNKSSTNITIASTGVYYNFTNFNCSGLNNGFVCGSNNLTTLINGTYLISADGSILGGNNGEYGFGISVNGENPETDYGCYTHFNGDGSHQPVSIGSCIRRLNKGDYIKLVVDDEANPAQNVGVVKMGLTALRIGN